MVTMCKDCNKLFYVYPQGERKQRCFRCEGNRRAKRATLCLLALLIITIAVGVTAAHACSDVDIITPGPAQELMGVVQLQELELQPQINTGTFTATAYTLECGNGDGYTAAMTRPKVNRTVAVDPQVIPLGTEVFINGQGPYIAEDTGAKIKGNIVDIYTGSGEQALQQALAFGRRQVRVTWVRGGGSASENN